MDDNAADFVVEEDGRNAKAPAVRGERMVATTTMHFMVFIVVSRFPTCLVKVEIRRRPSPKYRSDIRYLKYLFDVRFRYLEYFLGYTECPLKGLYHYHPT